MSATFDATVTDRVEDTVDYAEVCDVVNLVAQQRTYKTLERLCAAIADRLIEQYERARGVGQGRKARAAARLRRHRSVGRGVARGRMTAPRRAPATSGSGSNVGDRRAMLERAAGSCRRRGVEVLASSSVYETEPVGLVLDQRDFYNACLRVQTGFEPESCWTRARTSSARSAARPAAFGTGPARSTSTCCCSGRSSIRRPG